MKVKIKPNYSSSGKNHHIIDGYMVCDSVAENLFLDGSKLNLDNTRYLKVKQIIDKSPDKIELYSSL